MICTFKIIHKLDEINEKKLSELENRNYGKFEIIDVKLNNRKTKIINDNNFDIASDESTKNTTTEISNIINEKNTLSEKPKNTVKVNNEKDTVQEENAKDESQEVANVDLDQPFDYNEENNFCSGSCCTNWATGCAESIASTSR